MNTLQLAVRGGKGGKEGEGGERRRGKGSKLQVRKQMNEEKIKRAPRKNKMVAF